jgi:hypothetical protein
LGLNDPTGEVCLSSQWLPHPLQLAFAVPMSSPQVFGFIEIQGVNPGNDQYPHTSFAIGITVITAICAIRPSDKLSTNRSD